MAIKLKPCPFCDGAAVMQEGAIKGDYKAECGNFACIGSYLFKWHPTKEKAAEAWNRRAGDDAGKSQADA